MQKIFFCFTILFLQCLAINAQVPTSAENLIAEAKKIEIEAKAITQQAIDLRKQATAKKEEAAKEQDNEVATKLKNEATLMEQQAKEKMAEAAVLRKQATEKRKQAAELVKQNKTKIPVTTNPTIATIPISPQNNSVNKKLTGGFVELFEYANYEGRSVKFYKNTETKNLRLPFTPTNISLKFSDEENLIVFIRESMTDQKNLTYLNSIPSLQISTNNLSYIRVGKKAKVEIDFNGLLYKSINSTTCIHSDDCKKLYGNISYKIYELDRENGEAIKTPMLYSTQNQGYANETSFSIFNKERGTDYTAPFVYNAYDFGIAHNKKGGLRRSSDNVYGQKFLQSIAPIPNAKLEFFVDSLSYAKKRRVILEIDLKIGSAHKSCNICTDFTWDAAMTNTHNEKICLPYNLEEITFLGNRNRPIKLDIIQLGPFREMIFQERPFIGPEHPTLVQFIAKLVN